MPTPGDGPAPAGSYRPERDPSAIDPVRLLGWLTLAVSLVVQVVGLYSSDAPGPEGVPGLDKVSHLAGFGVPATLAWLLGARWVVLLLVVHALVSEPLQGWLAPTRRPDLLDTIADLIGIALGVGLGVLLRRARHGRRPSWGDEDGKG